MLQNLRPDPTFYPSPRLAMEAEPEHIAYTVLLSPDRSRPDALAVIDVDRQSASHGSVINRLVMPFTGDEFHHFGWNACSSALSPLSGHATCSAATSSFPASARRASTSSIPSPIRAHPSWSRRSNRKNCCARPAIRVPTPCIAGRKASTSAPWAAPARTARRGRRASSSWTAKPSISWGAGKSTAGRRSCTTISGGTCRATTWCRANGGCRRSSRTASWPKTCWPTSTATRCTSGDLRERRHLQTIDLGANHQMALEIRPAHDPTREYGFLGVVVDTTNLEGSIWTWYRENGKFQIRRRPRPSRPNRPTRTGCRPAEGLRRGAAADQRHRPVARRPLPVRRLLGHRRAAPVRRERPDEAGAGRQRAHRRHRRTHARIRTAVLSAADRR
jgi:selenium-binding protein 1